MKIKFGPAGLGPVKTALATLEHYRDLGLRACEIAFTYGAYIKKREDAESIGAKARELDISLSIHAPYYLNLNSEDATKREATKKRILDCCKIGAWLGAKTIVFHPGYYGKDKEVSYQNIKKGIIDIMGNIKKEDWNLTISAETMGKVNVFGSIEEISRLVRETGCSFCLDFAHILARDKAVDYERIRNLFPQKEWHVHFSGIVYGEKGEKHHRKTEKEEWTALLKYLPSDNKITVINESPSCVNDSVEGLVIWKNIH